MMKFGFIDEENKRITLDFIQAENSIYPQDTTAKSQQLEVANSSEQQAVNLLRTVTHWFIDSRQQTITVNLANEWPVHSFEQIPAQSPYANLYRNVINCFETNKEILKPTNNVTTGNREICALYYLRNTLLEKLRNICKAGSNANEEAKKLKKFLNQIKLTTNPHKKSDQLSTSTNIFTRGLSSITSIGKDPVSVNKDIHALVNQFSHVLDNIIEKQDIPAKSKPLIREFEHICNAGQNLLSLHQETLALYLSKNHINTSELLPLTQGQLKREQTTQRFLKRVYDVIEKAQLNILNELSPAQEPKPENHPPLEDCLGFNPEHKANEIHYDEYDKIAYTLSAQQQARKIQSIKSPQSDANNPTYTLLIFPQKRYELQQLLSNEQQHFIDSDITKLLPNNQHDFLPQLVNQLNNYATLNILYHCFVENGLYVLLQNFGTLGVSTLYKGKIENILNILERQNLKFENELMQFNADFKKLNKEHPNQDFIDYQHQLIKHTLKTIADHISQARASIKLDALIQTNKNTQQANRIFAKLNHYFPSSLTTTDQETITLEEQYVGLWLKRQEAQKKCILLDEEKKQLIQDKKALEQRVIEINDSSTKAEQQLNEAVATSAAAKQISQRTQTDYLAIKKEYDKLQNQKNDLETREKEITQREQNQQKILQQTNRLTQELVNSNKDKEHLEKALKEKADIIADLEDITATLPALKSTIGELELQLSQQQNEAKSIQSQLSTSLKETAKQLQYQKALANALREQLDSPANAASQQEAIAVQLEQFHQSVCLCLDKITQQLVIEPQTASSPLLMPTHFDAGPIEALKNTIIAEISQLKIASEAIAEFATKQLQVQQAKNDAEKSILLDKNTVLQAHLAEKDNQLQAHQDKFTEHATSLQADIQKLQNQMQSMQNKHAEAIKIQLAEHQAALQELNIQSEKAVNAQILANQKLEQTHAKDKAAWLEKVTLLEANETELSETINSLKEKNKTLQEQQKDTISFSTLPPSYASATQQNQNTEDLPSLRPGVSLMAVGGAICAAGFILAFAAHVGLVTTLLGSTFLLSLAITAVAVAGLATIFTGVGIFAKLADNYTDSKKADTIHPTNTSSLEPAKPPIVLVDAPQPGLPAIEPLPNLFSGINTNKGGNTQSNDQAANFTPSFKV